MAEKDTIVKKPVMYKVRDPAAKGEKGRTHEIIIQTYADGSEPLTKNYTLYSEVDCDMPMDHALKFLKPGFQVFNADGQILAPPMEIERGSKAWDLPDNQVVANLDELSKPALFKRCKVQPGSEHLSQNSTPQDLIGFLTAQRRKDKRAHMTDAEREAAALVAGAGAESMGMADLSKMMPDSPLLGEVRQ